MKNKEKINSITLAAIFAAIYIIMSAISIFIPVLDAIILVIMPIFATYYAARYSFKEVLIFNIATILLCFLVTVSDPFFAVLYIFPTLVVGDVFGLLYKTKVPYYTSYFVLSITFLLTNIFSFYLTNVIYEIDLLKEIFNNEGFSKYFSLSFLLIFSMIESFVCQKMVTNELKKFHLEVKVEESIPTYYYPLCILLGLSCVGFYFVWTNLYLCLFALFLFIASFSIYRLFKNAKQKYLLAIIFLLVIFMGAIPLISFKKYDLVPMIIIGIVILLQIVYLCKIMYNYKKEAQK